MIASTHRSKSHQIHHASERPVDDELRSDLVEDISSSLSSLWQLYPSESYHNTPRPSGPKCNSRDLTLAISTTHLHLASSFQEINPPTLLTPSNKLTPFNMTRGGRVPRSRVTMRTSQAIVPVEQVPLSVQSLDVYDTIRTFAQSSLDDKIFLDYAPFINDRGGSFNAAMKRRDWVKVCETISLQKTWLD